MSPWTRCPQISFIVSYGGGKTWKMWNPRIAPLQAVTEHYQCEIWASELVETPRIWNDIKPKDLKLGRTWESQPMYNMRIDQSPMHLTHTNTSKEGTFDKQWKHLKLTEAAWQADSRPWKTEKHGGEWEKRRQTALGAYKHWLPILLVNPKYDQDWSGYIFDIQKILNILGWINYIRKIHYYYIYLVLLYLSAHSQFWLQIYQDPVLQTG